MKEFIIEYIWYVLACGLVSIFVGASYSLLKKKEGFDFLIVFAFVFVLSEMVFGELLSATEEIANVILGMNMILAMLGMVFAPLIRNYYFWKNRRIRE